VEMHKNISQGSWSVGRDYSKVNPWLNWAALLVQLSCWVNGTTSAGAAAAAEPKQQQQQQQQHR